MSYDLFFQGFIAGESAGSRRSEMLAVLAPHIAERRGAFLRIEIGDGAADIYLSDDGMMANHISGTDPWDLLVTGAKSANWVILPIDGPICVTGPSQREQRPEGLGEGIVVVTSGAELRAAIDIH
ncbi:hypothetical protein M6D93_04480 [Jatrophihabitans telluris]|uniref:Uncharacterized protein n=1 Tax=Jatrophihabitans telluris TaxID=2038343 RepID=A0ABY4R0X7_9ACTN|nr:hypothetical protein [Jatrophihabitans telluris]UQX89263.1 hypothetical protein M6D93_04480 [Jatrophihabitans telluris]